VVFRQRQIPESPHLHVDLELRVGWVVLGCHHLLPVALVLPTLLEHPVKLPRRQALSARLEVLDLASVQQ
jgi:hypothetical protein